MLPFLYASGSLIALYLTFSIFAYKNIPKISRLVLISVAILPLGKLIYLPIQGFMGLKFQFIFSSIVGLLWFIFKGFNRNMLIILLPISISLLSIIFLEDYSQLFFYRYIELAGIDEGNYTGGRESVLFRFLSLCTLLIYAACIFSFILENKTNSYLVAKYFVNGVFLASLVGVIIFIQVWLGNISVIDLAPISADSHVVGSFYRFNPGANVNEFSMLIAFAIFLLPFCRFNKKEFSFYLFFFILCQFAGLTRSSYIGLLLGILFGIFFANKPTRIFWYLSIFTFFTVFIFSILYAYVPEIKLLIDTRFAFDIGISGNERLDKFSYVFSEAGSSAFRFMFGFGWATNLYVHNVYLQLLYEVGMVGLLAFITLFIYLVKDVFKLKPSLEKSSLAAMIAFIGCSAFFQHTLYHTQTWLILGFIAGVSKFVIYEYRKYP